MTYSEVVDVSGYVGNFEVTIMKKPHYVDQEKCTGCGACVAACPVEALKVVNEKVEVNEETCIDCGTCVDECPVQALSL